MSKPEKHAALQTRSCHTVITTTAHMMLFESTSYPILDPGTTLQVQGHSSMTKTVQLQSFVVSVAGRKSAMPSAHANDSTHEHQTCKERQLDGCRACRQKRVYTCMYMYVYIYICCIRTCAYIYVHLPTKTIARKTPYESGSNLESPCLSPASAATVAHRTPQHGSTLGSCSNLRVFHRGCIGF